MITLTTGLLLLRIINVSLLFMPDSLPMRPVALGLPRCHWVSFVRLVSLIVRFVFSPQRWGKSSCGVTFSICCPIMSECTDHRIFLTMHSQYLSMFFNWQPMWLWSFITVWYQNANKTHWFHWEVFFVWSFVSVFPTDQIAGYITS